MPVFPYCCCKVSNKTGSLAIGVILLTLTVAHIGMTIGFMSGWEHFDISFLVDASNKLRNSCEESKMNMNYTGNCTKREWAIRQVDNLHERLGTLSEELKEMGPVWKNELISLWAFLPWYAFACVLLILGALREIKLLLIIWMLATLVWLIWGFVLHAILFSFDTTIAFVLVLSMLYVMEFAVMCYFILIVFSFYQELTAKTIKELIIGRAEDYMEKINNTDD